MSKESTRDGLIASSELSAADVPDADEEFVVLETFCLTFDGYQGGRYSIDDIMRETERIEHKGLDDATLDELRAAAFFRQREYRWSTDQGQTDEPLARKIRCLVGEIRRRVSGQE